MRILICCRMIHCMSAAPVNLPRESVLFSRLINTITEFFEPGCALMTWYIKVIALIADVLLSIAVQSAICIFCAEKLANYTF